jgi:hypothetical protein
MKTLSKTFYRWEFDDIEDICTIEISEDEFFKKACEWYDYNSIDEVTESIADKVWDELFEEWEEENQKDVEQWENDLEYEPA